MVVEVMFLRERETTNRFWFKSKDFEIPIISYEILDDTHIKHSMSLPEH